jgi:hypothetical protein
LVKTKETDVWNEGMNRVRKFLDSAEILCILRRNSPLHKNKESLGSLNIYVSSGHSSWLQIQGSLVRFPALLDFLRSSGSGTEPREDNCEAT